MNTQNEIWKPIPGYEGQYEVSDQGRVRSLDRTITNSKGVTSRLTGRTLRSSPTKAGYPIVQIPPKKRYVHRLVLEAFIGSCPQGMECRHLDGNPSNNRLDNLVWGTHSENNRDIVTHGKHNYGSRTHCKRGHKLDPPNLVPSVLKQGRRSCLACSRATAHAHDLSIEKQSPEFQRLSDQKYAALMAK